MYSLDELASITGVNRRTLRHWIQHGLVPHAQYPPGVRSRFCAYYTPSHVKRIRDIIEIKDQNMTEVDIRDRFNPIDADDE